jgi:gluconate 2-dehydrogenase gamma chain
MNTTEAVILALENNPSVIVPLVREIPRSILKRRPAPGEWSAHEIACHLAGPEGEGSMHRSEQDDRKPLARLWAALRGLIARPESFPQQRGRSPGSYPVPDPPETAPATGVLRFFTPHEARSVEALTARILPSGPDGFGAREAGVPNYIDYLLAQRDAFGQPVYRQLPYARAYAGEHPPAAEPSVEGPVIWVKKEELKRYGFQTALDPQEVYRRGLAALDRCARSRFDADFVDLPPDAQNDIVAALAADTAAGFDEPSPRVFFEMVEEHTIEGAFSDPQYGGNLDKIGWKAIRYPAAQRTYSPDDMKNEEFDLAPQALAELHHIHARMPAAHGSDFHSTLAMAMPLTPRGYHSKKRTT